MVWSDGTSVRIGQPRMKYGWFEPPVYQSSIPASAIFRSGSVAGKSVGVKKSSGASVSQALQPASVSAATRRSEEHTSELQSRFDLVCRLLLEKKNDRRWSGACRVRRRSSHASRG